MKEEQDAPVIQETLEFPTNVIDITTRKRAAITARPDAELRHRPYLQLVKSSPSELPAA